MKVCRKCGVRSRNFTSRRGVADGLSSWCRPCVNKVNGDRQRVADRKCKQSLIDHMGKRCSHCRGKFHPAAFDFHHIDPSKKDLRLINLSKKDWVRVLEEADKCLLLCANCHRIEHVRIRDMRRV